MPINIVKLCVGADSIEDLSRWQDMCVAAAKHTRQKPRLVHTTFQRPKRADEVLAGGSLYWVIKGIIQVRQRIIGFDEGQKDDGSPCCLFVLDPSLVPVKGKPRRPFQGWRYLKPEDAPADLVDQTDGAAQLPPAMQRELAELGLL
ncbi:MAG: DUF1489 domain-containing protein [Pseudomonadota bacterium]